MKTLANSKYCNESSSNKNDGIIVVLDDDSKIIVNYNGNRYIVECIENKELFDYMQSCKTNVRQKHKQMHNLLKCFNDALRRMSYELPNDRAFVNRLRYKPKTIFIKRNYSDFQFNI